MGQIIQFLREVKIELIKVTWPKRDELLGSTTVVLILSLILSIFIGIADTIISRVVIFILAR
ncbi:preprotein translocase subunit SecE [candidate division WOR-3 bacterium]|nr:preprotein translocase subunit SecE [candidate division WOR-3 bacterium]MCK4585340.1 preprotein translocase subunit SecE [candidate division WOR-3 bacterium]TET78259.1 MAG: preprotein translocase subunit SecE [Candidatus Cloacimonadota bacterium]